VPGSRGLPRNDLPAPRWLKRRMIGVQRTLDTFSRRCELEKREIWLGAETKHLFHTRHRESQVMGTTGAFAVIREKEQTESMCCGDGRSKSLSPEKQFAQMSVYL